MPVEFRNWIERGDLRESPEKLFIFGDNLAQTGFGGQARSMRGEPNAVGLPTKRDPGISAESYLKDEDLQIIANKVSITKERLLKHVRLGGTVVWPSNGIGTGLSKLDKKAPEIFRFYERFLDDLLEAAGKVIGAEGQT